MSQSGLTLQNGKTKTLIAMASNLVAICSDGLQPSSHGCLGVPKWPATEGEEELGINNKFVLELLGQLMFPLKNECYCI